MSTLSKADLVFSATFQTSCNGWSRRDKLECSGTDPGRAGAGGRHPALQRHRLLRRDSLNELDQTLQVLAFILGMVVAGTTAAGRDGLVCLRRVLRPLTVVTEAARNIAGGDYEARLIRPSNRSSGRSRRRSTTWWTSWRNGSNATADSPPT
jgi:hypothetical protein